MSSEDSSPGISPRTYWTVLGLIVLLGALLRFIPSAGFTSRGFDEHIYVYHLSFIEAKGLAEYPEHCLDFLQKQAKDSNAIPPPTRILYLYCAHLWRTVTGAEQYGALVQTSALFGTFTLLLTAGFIRRLAGPALSLAVTALMSVAPNQIHHAQHALNDGFLSFWCVLALWSLWESLQRPGHRGWLVTYGLSLCAMVLLKENSFFVVVGIGALLLLNRWLHFGTAGRPLWLVTFLAPLLGVVVLVFLAGGIDVLIAIYQLLVAKSQEVPYNIKNGDGPWYRYLLETMLVSPLVILLATGRAFQLRATDKASLYLLLFTGFTMALMVNVKYGMNYRYATIWDLPLRFLACAGLFELCTRGGSRARVLTVVATVAFALVELNQYRVFCMKARTYAFTPTELLQAVRIIK